MQRPVETEYSSTVMPAMQGSVETRSASEAQPESRSQGASRAVDGPVKPEGGSSRSNPDVEASRGSRGSMRRKPREAASRAKGRRPMRVGGRSPAQPEEIRRRKSMDRRRSAGCAERRCKSVVRACRAEDTKTIRAGGLAAGRAGVQAEDASRRSGAGATRGNDASESWRSAAGEPRTQHRLYC